MEKKTLEKIIYEALGETSALFMTKEERGVDIVMPTEEMNKIAERTLLEIRNLSI